MKHLIYSLLFLLPGLLSGQLMYPGDANNDGIANHLDLLPIGVAFNQFGNPRPGASQNWFAQAFIPWTYQLPETGVNGGYLDANGDALIDTLDIDAIALNYEMMQDSAGPEPWEPPFNCIECPPPVLRIEFEEPFIVVPDTAFAVIVLDYGVPIPTELGAMGIAFGIEYEVDTLLIDDTQTQVIPNDTPERMFIVATNQGATAFRSVAPFRAQLAAAHFGNNGFIFKDTLARVGIIIEDIQRDTTTAEFSIRFEEPIVLINDLEQRIGLNRETGSIKVLKIDSSSPSLLADPFLRLWPNPATDRLWIAVANAPLEEVRLIDLTGKLRLTQQLNGSTEGTLEVGQLPAGMYLVEVRTGNGILLQKIVLQD